MKIIITLVLSMLFIFGCDKSCKNTIEDFATIQNNTGLDITLSFCKGHYGQTNLRLLPTTSGIVSLGSREEGKSSSGIGTCNSKSEKNSSLAISLSEASFGFFLLCYRQTDNTYVVANINQACPYGYLQQTTSGPCEDFE
jgi:hypothetical protein